MRPSFSRINMLTGRSQKYYHGLKLVPENHRGCTIFTGTGATPPKLRAVDGTKTKFMWLLLDAHTRPFLGLSAVLLLILLARAASSQTTPDEFRIDCAPDSDRIDVETECIARGCIYQVKLN